MSGPKPIYSSISLDFASDPTYATAGDGSDGTPTKITPSLGLVRQGGRPARQPPAQIWNWVLNQLGQVCLGLIDHTAELESADAINSVNIIAVDERVNEVDDRIDALESLVSSNQATLLRYASETLLNLLGNSGAAVFATTARAAYYDKVTKTWYVCGTSGLAKATSDMGATWRDVLIGETKSLNGMATNGLGTVVYCTSGRYVQVAQDMSEATSLLTGEYDCFGVLPGNISSDIANSHGYFCCVGDSATTPTLRISTSLDGYTWTSSPLPTGWVNGNPKLYRKPDGRLILAALSYADGKTVSVSHSDDGGFTWSAANVFVLGYPTGVTSATYSAIYLGYDVAKNRFLLVGHRLATDTVNALSVHYASTDDGVTWTKIGAGLHNSGIRKPGCCGGVWVATLEEWNTNGDVIDIRSSLVYSIDDGVTWKRAGYSFFYADAIPGTPTMAATDVGVWEGPNGLLVLTVGRAYLTARLGEPNLGSAA
jgi:hypothetical protein